MPSLDISKDIGYKTYSILDSDASLLEGTGWEMVILLVRITVTMIKHREKTNWRVKKLFILHLV